MKRNPFDWFKSLKHVVEQGAQRMAQRRRRDDREMAKTPPKAPVFIEGKTYNTNRARRRREMRAKLRTLPRKIRQQAARDQSFEAHFRYPAIIDGPLTKAEKKNRKKLRQIYKRIARLRR